MMGPFVPFPALIVMVPEYVGSRPSNKRRSMVKMIGVMLLLMGMAGFAFGPPAAPEISPDSATTALALVSGALLVMRGRRRK